MSRKLFTFLQFLIIATVFVFSTTRLSYAAPLGQLPTATPQAARPLLVPTPPSTNAKAYILIDANSGKILAEKNAYAKRPPASLTKLMTLYVVSNAIRQGRIKLDDTVRISKRARHAGGSTMFLKQGQRVKVRDLIKGVIVDSGNDACVALAEYVAGSEKAFADLMNQTATMLGMKNSHFTDSTGMPNPDHYVTAYDMSILTRALIRDFPEYYPWYKQKWFKFNNVRQPNRNRLLWRDKSVDGLKTGHTKSAGYCLIASAKRNNMRIISVVMGTPSDAARAEDSQRLLTYGFRFFKTAQVYKAGQTLSNARIWRAAKKTIPVGVAKPVYVTFPRGQYSHLKANIKLTPELQAPIKKGQQVGTLTINLANKTLVTRPLIALSNDPTGGIWQRMTDSLSLKARRWFGSGSDNS